MQIIRQLAPPPARPPLVLAAGNFDGAHLGHAALLRRACARAKEAGAAFAAMTFEPHPLSVLRPNKPLFRLYSRRDKFALLRAAGAQYLFAPRFTPTFSAMPAARFADALFANMGVCRLLVGENFRFGAGGRGDVALLQDRAARHAAAVEALPLLALDDAAVSSGRVRVCLREGRFDDAAALLGRRWRLGGRVCYGAGLGRKWGFPTANLQPAFVPPCLGIFAARAFVAGRGKSYWAAMSVGKNPSVKNDGRVRAEAHFLDFDEDIYGMRIDLQPVKKLRDEKHFASIASLRAAIAQDVEQTRAVAAEAKEA